MRVRVAMMTAVAATLACGAARAGVTVYTSESAFAAAVAIQHTATFESFSEGRRASLTDDGIAITPDGPNDLYVTSAGEPLARSPLSFPTRALSADGDEDFFFRLASGDTFGAIGLDYATNAYAAPILSLYGVGGGLIGAFTVPQGPERLGFFGLVSTTRISFATSVVDRGYFEDTAVDNVRLGEGLGAAGGVPEPAAWVLMVGGFGLAGAGLRRRRGALVQTA